MMERNMRISMALCAALLLGACDVRADWTLDNAGSSLSFVTVKAIDVAEVHTFKELSGSVGTDGHARVVIQLASVDTLIPIRDERMREILFQTDLFPTATVDTRIEPGRFEALPAGTSERLSADLTLSIRDVELPVTAEILVTRLASDRILVATTKPVIINAAAVSLAEGVEELREVAGLPSISKAVPVSFILQFTSS
jgi:polyisoprenoid-binding protein YceI